MSEPLWLTRAMVDGFHDLQLRLFGGLAGTRDGNAIEAALSRPVNKWLYDDERDMAVLAAAYGYGIAQNHGFVDGNKRAGFLSMAVFLDLNGWDLAATEVAIVQTMRAVASGSMREEELAAWVRAHSAPA